MMKVFKKYISEQIDTNKLREPNVQFLSNLLKEKAASPSVIEEILSSKETLSTIHYILKKNTKTNDDIYILNTYLKHKDKFISFIQRDEIKDTNMDELLAKITRNLKLQTAEGNSFLFRVGEPGAKFYIILKGSVSVLLPEEKKVKMSYNQYKNYLCHLYKNNEMYLFNKTYEANIDIFNISINEIKKEVSLQNDKKQISQTSSISPLTLHEYIQSINVDWYNSKNNTSIGLIVTILCYHKIIVLQEGNYFGEIALVSEDQLRTASIFVNEKSYFGTLDAESYKSSIKSLQDKMKRENTLFILSTGLFKGISYSLFLNKFWNLFVFRHFKKGDVLFEDTNNREVIFFILRGEIRISSEMNLKKVNNLIRGNKKDYRYKIIKDDDIGRYEDLQIAIINDRNILGIGDVIMDGKYFCRGECVSNEALCFSLEVKILNELIKKFPCIEKNYKQIEKEKRNAMVNRLKMIKFAKMNIMIGGLQNKFEKEIEQITQENSIELKKLRRKSIENKNKKRFFVSFYNSRVNLSQEREPENSKNDLTISTNFNTFTKKHPEIASPQHPPFNNNTTVSSILDNSNSLTLLKQYSLRASVIKPKKHENLHNLKRQILSISKTSFSKSKERSKDKYLLVSKFSINTNQNSLSNINNSSNFYNTTCPINYVDCLIMDKSLNKKTDNIVKIKNTKYKLQNKSNHFLPINYLPKSKPLKLLLLKKSYIK